MFTISHNTISLRVTVIPVAEFVRPLINVALEFKSKVSLFFFNQKKWLDLSQKSSAFLAAYRPSMQSFVVRICSLLGTDRTTEQLLHEDKRARISHGDASVNLQNFAGSRLSSTDADITLPVEQTGCVVNFSVHGSQVIDGMMANSVDIRCPARKSAEGQYRAKQGEIPGVCNEHVPSPEGKICSGLHGNMQRATEMIAPVQVLAHSASIYEQVTDRNTDYLELVVHEDADLEMVDEIRPYNQDAVVMPILWMGNLTLSNRHLQGVVKA
jgi:hypothetical protein